MQRTAQTIRTALGKVPWIDACGPGVVDVLAAGAHVQQHAQGATVSMRGRLEDDLVVIAEGALEFEITNSEGRRLVTHIYGPGQVFNLVCALDGLPRLADAYAKEPTVLVRVARPHLLSAMDMSAQLSRSVLEMVCGYVRWLHEILEAHLFSPFPARLARVLLAESHRTGQAAVRLTQSKLADMLGVTRQSTNVELRRLAAQGVLELGRNRIELCDRPALERCARLGG